MILDVGIDVSGYTWMPWMHQDVLVVTEWLLVGMVAPGCWYLYLDVMDVPRCSRFHIVADSWVGSPWMLVDIKDVRRCHGCT